MIHDALDSDPVSIRDIILISRTIILFQHLSAQRILLKLMATAFQAVLQIYKQTNKQAARVTLPPRLVTVMKWAVPRL